MMTSQLTFAFLIASAEQAKQGVLLARSIRAFGGEFANAPIVTAVPADRPLTAATSDALDALQVKQHVFVAPEAIRQFPLATKVLAAAAIEAVAETAVLAWMDTDSLVINPPRPLLLPAGSQLGYRPVDHTLIGSRWAQPIGPFWQKIYTDCQVAVDALSPMTTSVDEVVIRPYFNAGLLVARPGRGLLQSWRDDFTRLYQQPAYAPFYQADARYAIFMHQAVLAGTLLRELPGSAMTLLPHLVNYPLHMHSKYPSARRVDRINDLMSCRYDTLAEEADWHGRFPIDNPLKQWLQTYG